MRILYKQGDATEPDRLLKNSIDIIVHCVNDCGVMGSGIAASIRKKWPVAFTEYKKLFDLPAIDRATAQGQCQIIKVGSDLFVGNLFAQSGIGDSFGMPAVRYDALEESLRRLKHALGMRKQKEKPVYIHTGRICCALAGGSWALVEGIINNVFSDMADIQFTVYDFPGGSFNP